MDEKKQIFNAANLADKSAPEELDKKRASDFISSVLDKGQKRTPQFTRGKVIWISGIISIAACISFVVVFYGKNSHSIMEESFGTPQEIYKNNQTHASINFVDTLNVQPCDTTAHEIKIIQE